MGKKEPKKEYKDAELNKLKRRVKRLESENRRLKSELNSYDEAFKKTKRFLKDNTDELSLDDLIQAAKNGSSLKKTQEDVEDACPKCLNKVKKINSPVGIITVCDNIHCDFRKTEKKVD